MTTLTFYKKSDMFVGFECSGHTEYAEYGSDILCASISTVTQFVVMFAQKHLKLNLDISVDDECGYIKALSNEIDIQFNNQIDILYEIAKTYKQDFSEYITLKISEV